MNCDTMLVRLLDAERDVLDGQGPSALAVHLRECSRCSAVARQLSRTTEQLAEAVQVRSPRVLASREPRIRPARRFVVNAALASIAASVLIGIVINYRLRAAIFLDKAHDLAPIPTASARPANDHTAPVAEITAPRSPMAPAMAQTQYPRRFAAAVAIAPVPFPASDPAAPVSAAVSALAQADPGALAVDPPLGVRAAVLNTSTPGMTVVWLY